MNAYHTGNAMLDITFQTEFLTFNIFLVEKEFFIEFIYRVIFRRAVFQDILIRIARKAAAWYRMKAPLNFLGSI